MVEPVSLAARIDAFCLEHRLCARLDGNVVTLNERLEADTTGRRYVVMKCCCGASLMRPADEP
jgi:hypothetical protein